MCTICWKVLELSVDSSIPYFTFTGLGRFAGSWKKFHQFIYFSQDDFLTSWVFRKSQFIPPIVYIFAIVTIIYFFFSI